MPLIPKPNYNQIFASQAPDIDKPAVFNNYPEGWGTESRPNNGKPTIKGFNYLQQTSDLKDLWILQNGACLPYDESIEYAEGAPVLKDGVIQYKTAGGFSPAIAEKPYVLKYFTEGVSYPLNARVMLNNGDIVRSTVANNTTNPNTDMTGWEPEGQDLLDSSQSSFSALIIADLLEVKNPKPYQKKYVSSVGAWYTYYPDTNQVPNGVTVVGKWVMDTQPFYLASWFATANVQEDQKSGLRIGYAYATSKGRSFVIDNLYWVGVTAQDRQGLNILTNSVLNFIPKAGKLRLLSSNQGEYQILRVSGGVSGYVVNFADLDGDRLRHVGSTGEWGHGIQIAQSSNGYWHKPKVKDCWGDLIDIGRLTTETSEPTNTTIFEPHLSGARRNGISPRSFVDVSIIRPYVEKVGDYDGVVGAWPKAAIDVEPNDNSGNGLPECINLLIDSPTISDCYAGIYFYNFQARRYEVRVTGTTKLHNCENTGIGAFSTKAGSTGFVEVEKVIITGQNYNGFTNGWVQSKCKFNISNFSIGGDIESFIIRNGYNGTLGDGTETIGGVSINFNIPDTCTAVVAIIADDINYTQNSRYLCLAESAKKLVINAASLTTLGQFANYGANYYVDGSMEFNASSPRFTVRSTAKIKYRETTDTATRELLTDRDFAKRTVVFDANSLKSDYGVRITGLTVTQGGVVKTKVETKQLGAYITYQKISGGETIIHELVGNWIFS